MRTLERLRLSALETCNFRGHKMNQFTHYAKGRCYSTCKICYKAVSVIVHPAPNEIYIGGEALALSCND